MQAVTLWKRAALAGFVVGVLIALAMLAIVKVAASGNPKLWERAVDLSTIVFPSHIFLLPLSDRASFPHDLLFYFAAIIGNGIIYSVAVQVGAAVYLIAKRVVRHFV